MSDFHVYFGAPGEHTFSGEIFEERMKTDPITNLFPQGSFLEPSGSAKGHLASGLTKGIEEACNPVTGPNDPRETTYVTLFDLETWITIKSLEANIRWKKLGLHLDVHYQACYKWCLGWRESSRGDFA